MSDYTGPSPVIARISSANSMLDFSDNLVLAKEDDARNLYGTGGKGHNPNSTIRCAITNTKQRTYVTYNVEPYIFEIIQAVCISNMGKYSAIEDFKDSLIDQSINVGQLRGAFQTFCEAAQNGDSLRDSASKTAEQYPISNFSAGIPSYPLAINRDFDYSFLKVNPYSQGSDGYTDCSSIDITRRHFNNGEIQKKPWTITVSNFRCIPRKTDNGLYHATQGTMKDNKSAYIHVTDMDMYEACWFVNRFLRVYETALCVPNYLNAYDREVAARNEFRTAKDASAEKEISPRVKAELNLRKIISQLIKK